MIELPPSLCYTNDSKPGYHRVLYEEKFIYKDNTGKEIKNSNVHKRINGLVIPPQWEKVWICKNPKGHVQAIGRDAKGRKQYIYHPLWIKHIADFKYNNLKYFAKYLPIIRQQIEKDLRQKSWNKQKVIALAIKLMDENLLRVGNIKYQKENGTYGLTTLRKKHVKEYENKLKIKYKAKSGKVRELNIEHPVLKRLLKNCSELPGYELFKYLSNGKYIPIDSFDINDYLKKHTSYNITAKNFRTWGGTVLCIKLAPKAQEICSQNHKLKFESTLVKLVSKELNNTVSVCRKYYIHPRVLEEVTKNYSNTIAKKLRRFSSTKWISSEEKLVKNILSL